MRGQIETEDAILSPAFVISGAVAAGIASVSAMGYSLSTSLFSVGGVSVTAAGAIATVALLAAWMSNEPNPERMDDTAKYATYGTIALVLGTTFLPSVNSVVTSNDIVGLVVIAIEASGFYAISYLS